MKNFSLIQHSGFTWINVTKPSEKDLRELQKRFDLFDEDIHECMPHTERPKFIKREHYYFIVLHFPRFNRENKRMEFTEVDFFLSPTFLITIHDNTLLPIEAFFKESKRLEKKEIPWFQDSAARILCELWHAIITDIFASMHHVTRDINEVDQRMLTETPTQGLLEEILRLKNNVVTFRRVMQAQRNVLDRLVMLSGRELGLSSLQWQITSLKEYVAEIWNTLETQKESINALHEMNESSITLRTNEVMKTLTVISVVTFPLTLLATVFAIRAPGTPFVESQLGFWIIFGLVIIGAVGMVVVFKRRRWL